MPEFMYLQVGLFLAIIVVAVFFVLKSHSANNKWVPWCFGIVWLVGTVLYGYVYVHLETFGCMHTITGWLPLIVTSCVSATQMFIGSTHFFDNGFHDYFFSDDGFLPLVGLSFLSTIAIFLSAYVLFNLIIKRFSSKLRLVGSPANNQEVHVFFGNNTRSLLLAKDIKTCRNEAKIIIIEYPGENDQIADDSSLIGGLYRMFTTNHPGDSFVFLRAIAKLTDSPNETKLESILDIRGLDRWVFKNNTTLYFLSDDENDNKESLKVLKKCIDSYYLSGKCRVGHVFCHAKKDELSVNEEDYYRQRFNVTFIDSSSLSIRQILRADSSSLPINFVDIPVISFPPKPEELSNECRLGYVESDFCAAIFGFGELGHEAFNFLYEYGAFPRAQMAGKERKVVENPWKIYVFDKSVKEDRFKKRYPGFDMSKIIFDEMDVDVDSQWETFRDLAPEMELNYIFISTGNDERNLKTLIKIDECLEGVNVEKLRIMLKYSKSELESLFFNQIKNVKANVQLFGIEKDIWKFSIISDEAFVNKAMHFSTAYMRCADRRTLEAIIREDTKLALKELYEKDPDAALRKAGVVFWKNREDKIAHPDNMTNRPKLLRQRSQDMANTWHCYTKEQLIGNKYLDKYAMHLANLISLDYPASSSDRRLHAPAATDFELDLLENLAVCEHLRWNASHIAKGYQLGESTDDSKKIHNCIKDYYDLSCQVQHYDWMVVKSTLMMYAEKKNDN